MANAALRLSRAQVLGFRRKVGALDERLPPGPDALRRAAWTGLQDSMPRAALLSIHARMHATPPTVLEDASLVQLWGPRFSAYVVAEQDRAVFTLGRLPEDGPRRRRAEETADRLEAFLDGRRMAHGPIGHGLGVHPNSLRYAAPTGRVLIRWDGARQPTIWTVPQPATDASDARLELARRYLHVFGPGTADSFAAWAGITPASARLTFAALADTLLPVETPIGAASILCEDEPALLGPVAEPAPARLLPSGDTFFLLQGPDRELLVPDAVRRASLWTSRVWPGAVLVEGEIVGTWRRAGAEVSVEPWTTVTEPARRAVETEAEGFPLPDVEGRIRVRWVE